MKYKCLIVDDEPLARELLETHIARFPQFELVASCSDALKAYTFLVENNIDLLLLDIEMPFLKGTDFIKKLDHLPDVIITTAHREYALEGYELNVVDYLLKPITFERFFKAIDKFNHLHRVLDKNKNSENTLDSIFVPSGGKWIKIIKTQVIYIESMKDYIVIHLEDDKQMRMKYNISAIEKLLDHNFMRIHRSYIVNKNKLTSFSKQSIWLNSETELPVGESYRSSWTAYLGEIDLK